MINRVDRLLKLIAGLIAAIVVTILILNDAVPKSNQHARVNSTTTLNGAIKRSSHVISLLVNTIQRTRI
ncbi:hypothetical protein BH09BAC3_BH09BAC3_11850 [soil metagenome]